MEDFESKGEKGKLKMENGIESARAGAALGILSAGVAPHSRGWATRPEGFRTETILGVTLAECLISGRVLPT